MGERGGVFLISEIYKDAVMILCEKCGSDVSWTCDTIKLRGGVNVHLCVACLREWNDLCKDMFNDRDSELKARMAYLSGLATAGQCPDESAFLDVVKKETALDTECRVLAKEFLSVKFLRNQSDSLRPAT